MRRNNEVPPRYMLKPYYTLKPLIPRSVQILLRRQMVKHKLSRSSSIWPIDENAGRKPPFAVHWPDGKQFAVVFSHDVDTRVGVEKCERLVELETEMGVSSTYFIVPERYTIPDGFLSGLKDKGFEIGVHGLYHDGKLYESRATFKARSSAINRYLRDWGAMGFRSPSMHHNLEWLHGLDIEYDSSTFDTDPFEPQPDPITTIFPVWVCDAATDGGYVELPCTLPQDFTLFVLLRQKPEIWFRKVDWIASRGGMVMVLTHPDYMSFPGERAGPFEYSVDRYRELLEYIEGHYQGLYWRAVAKDVAKFWRTLVSRS